jgi:osmoprotectant transport system substrate-binding protein
MGSSGAPKQRGRGRAGLVACLAVLGTACVSFGYRSTEPIREQRDPSTILIGSFDFAESAVIAHLYAQALAAEGFQTKVLERVASREIMQPALEQGHVDIVPEYQGTLVEFLAPGSASASANATHGRLSALLADKDLVALDFAPAQNQNVIAVTSVMSGQHALQKISDLQPISRELTFGGPPECPSRPLCLKGLETTYGLSFREFQPLDAGGPLTVAALRARDIDVALLFATDPSIGNENFVALQDDMGLQPAENIVPVLRQELLDEHGSDLSEPLDAVSKHLTLDALRELNARAAENDRTPMQIAREWLEQKGLV